VELNQPGFEFGISALRTVFEEILKDDLRILPSQRTLLFQAASEVCSPSPQPHYPFSDLSLPLLSPAYSLLYHFSSSGGCPTLFIDLQYLRMSHRDSCFQSLGEK
jgi:hypothetical protein